MREEEEMEKEQSKALEENGESPCPRCRTSQERKGSDSAERMGMVSAKTGRGFKEVIGNLQDSRAQWEQ